MRDTENVAVFIDGGYLSKISQGSKIDFLALSHFLAGGKEKLWRCYYYNCLPWQDKKNPDPQDKRRVQDSQRFYDYLAKIPRMAVRLGKLKPLYREEQIVDFIQKQVDIFVGIDICTASNVLHVKKIVLLAGDGDMLPLLAHARDRGKLTSLYHGAKDSFDHSFESVVDEHFSLGASFFKKMFPKKK